LPWLPIARRVFFSWIYSFVFYQLSTQPL